MTHHINLYDASLLQRKQWLTMANLLFAVALLFLLLLGWGSWLRVQGGGLAADAAALDSQTKAAREESVALGTQLANRKPDAKLEAELAAVKALLGARQGILDALGQDAAAATIGQADYLRGLARQSVGGLWLTGFSASPDGSRMEIRGRTLDPALLPEYIRRLNAEPAFRGRRFAAVNVTVPATPPSTSTSGTAAVAATAPPPLFHEFALVPEIERPPGAGQ
jgi:hypothetical protein